MANTLFMLEACENIGFIDCRRAVPLCSAGMVSLQARCVANPVRHQPGAPSGSFQPTATDTLRGRHWRKTFDTIVFEAGQRVCERSRFD